MKKLVLVSLMLAFSSACSDTATITPPDGHAAGGGGGAGNETHNGPVKNCIETCTTAADCAVPGAAIYDASHFACNAGKCEWQGCKSNVDCTDALQSQNFACATPPGSPTPDCVATCATAADCTTSGNTLFDASHYACNQGMCQYTGCKSTADCTAGLQSNKFACVTAPGAPFASCEPTCKADSDCAAPGNPLYDAQHFRCTQGRCEWKGCKSTEECRSALQSPKLVCQ